MDLNHLREVKFMPGNCQFSTPFFLNLQNLMGRVKYFHFHVFMRTLERWGLQCPRFSRKSVQPSSKRASMLISHIFRNQKSIYDPTTNHAIVRNIQNDVYGSTCAVFSCSNWR